MQTGSRSDPLVTRTTPLSLRKYAVCLLLFLILFHCCSDTDRNFGVLLSDGCQPTSHPSAPPTRIPATLETIGRSRPSAAQPVVPERTTSHNPSSVLAGSTQGGARQRTAEATPPPPPVGSSSLLPPTTDIDSTVKATTTAPQFTLNTATTAGAFTTPQNYTHLDNRTTPASFPDRTEVHNVTADSIVSHSNMDNKATTSSQREQLTDVGTRSNTTGTTAGPSQTRKDQLPTATSPSNPLYVNTTATAETYKPENSFTVDNRNHHERTATSPSATTATTPSNNTTTQSAFSVNAADVDGNPRHDTATTRSTTTPSDHTASYNYLTQHNVTDSSKTNKNTFPPNRTTTDANNFTRDHNRTAGNSVATAANTDPTVSKNYTTAFTNTAGGAVTGSTTTGTLTPSPAFTNMNNNATVSASGVNATTVAPNETATGSFTPSALRDTQQFSLPASTSEVYTLSNTAAIPQHSAPSPVPPNTLTTATPHSVPSPGHGYTVGGPSVAGSSTANISQATTKDPAVSSSATTGNAGSQSAQTSVAATTPPFASAMATVSSPTKPGMYSSNPSHLKMFRQGEEINLNMWSRNNANACRSNHQKHQSPGGASSPAPGSNPRSLSAQLLSGEAHDCDPIGPCG